MKYIKKLTDIQNEKKLVGGKAWGLAQLLKIGVPVPDGFVIMTNAFNEFQSKELSHEFKEELLQCLNLLDSEMFAVRSSAVFEDSQNFSWAGQLSTYLNINKNNVLDKIQQCWLSINSSNVASYSEVQKQSTDKGVAVIVQAMARSQVSGVLFTVNPVTNNRNELLAEAVIGLGELLVQGTITPYNYVLDKKTGEVINSNHGEQVGLEKIFTTDKIKELYNLSLKIEKHFGNPQDIEWAIEENKIQILQSRPITTL